MRYFISSAYNPLKFQTCGNLMSKDGFLHLKRIMNTNVLIMVKEGILHITQNGIPYAIGPNQYIFLREKEEHFGHLASSGNLSYLWVHFSTNDTITAITQESYFDDMLKHSKESHQNCNYIMPEHGEVSLTNKAPVLFNQLLDLSRQKMVYSSKIIDYALSLLIMELSQEFIEMHYNMKQNISPNIARIMDWIKANYYKPISIAKLADEFGYNPDYLSSLFKKSTGITFINYINKTRIEASKALLAHYNLSVKETAYSCGFLDEKYFMKTFKRFESMTPSQYKRAFTRKMIN
jgi:YesN/AraC family two-component response regulator